MEKRSAKRPSSNLNAAHALSLCLSVALLAGCASRMTGVAPRSSVVVGPTVSTPIPVAADASLDKNEVIIDKPSALKSDTAGLMARITPQQQARITQAVRDSNTDAKAQLLIVQASPKMRSFIERLSCIRQYNDGKLQEAFSSFDRVVQENPAMAEAYYYRGLCSLGLSKIDAAKADFKKLLELEPDSSHAADAREFLKSL